VGIDAEMLIKYRGPTPSEDDLTRWSWDLCSSIGANNFLIRCSTNKQRAIEWCLARDDEWYHQSQTTSGKAYLSGGGYVYPLDNEYLLNVNLFSRYYDSDYTRGNILIICAIAEWIEQNLQPCEVWYGGDNGMADFRLFDKTDRERLRKHLYSPDGRSYGIHGERGTFPTPAPCDLCVPGENRFDRNSWESIIGVGCKGCGKLWNSRDQGKSWTVEK